MPASIVPSQNPAPLKAAKASLIAELLSLFTPHYPTFPSPDDHESMAAHIRDAAIIFDRYLAAVGSEVRDNAVISVDANLFSGTLAAAVSDEAYACEQQAEALREFASERRHARGGW